MPLLASIDIGSNSVRLLIARVEGGRIMDALQDRRVTQLAEGISSRGLLGQNNMDETMAALKSFVETSRGHGVRAVKAIGTSALREAANSGDFIRRILAETGLEVEVVSGEREAELTAKGVLSGMEVAGPALIIDIGGGSTEWVYWDGGLMAGFGSVPVGVVKLHERHIRSDPPDKGELFSLDTEAEAWAEEIRNRSSGVMKKGAGFIETAGTATTLAAMDLSLDAYDKKAVEGHVMQMGTLMALSEKLSGLTLDERAGLKGLEPSRADLIIPGIHFTIKLMEKLGFDRVTVSDGGLLEGALLGLAREVRD